MQTFHSTTTKVITLQQKQQEQLVVMLRALEDGDAEKMKGEANVPSMSLYVKTIQDSPKMVKVQHIEMKIEFWTIKNKTIVLKKPRKLMRMT